MSDLSDLYQEVILDHNRRPHHFGRLEAPTRTAQGHNPLCGDRLVLDLTIADGRVADISFEGSGCAISKASASLMTDAIVGRPLAEVREVFSRFLAMITAPVEQLPPEDDEQLGSLVALAGVREFPMRIKCASLAWHTLKSALAGADESPVKTE
jgi:nitrogen fixation protein NifU and related proteins